MKNLSGMMVVAALGLVGLVGCSQPPPPNASELAAAIVAAQAAQNPTPPQVAPVTPPLQATVIRVPCGQVGTYDPAAPPPPCVAQQVPARPPSTPRAASAPVAQAPAPQAGCTNDPHDVTKPACMGYVVSSNDAQDQALGKIVADLRAADTRIEAKAENAGLLAVIVFCQANPTDPNCVQPAGK